MKLLWDIDSMIEFAKDGIVSKTIIDESHGKTVLFCMAAGQSLSEHTASFPVTIYVMRGKAEVKLGDERHSVRPDVFLNLTANLIHAIKAEEDLVFLLTVFRR